MPKKLRGFSKNYIPALPVDKTGPAGYNDHERALLQRSALASQLIKLTAWGLSKRSVRFWGDQNHQRQREDETDHEPQGFRPAPVSHKHHLPPIWILLRGSNGGLAAFYVTALFQFRLYHSAVFCQTLPPIEGVAIRKHEKTQ